MKIGIEGQRLFRQKKHGMDMVALELIRNLQEIDHVNEYFIFVKPDEDSSALKATANFKIIPLEGGSYPMWEQFALPKAAKKYGCDILHCTSNTAPINSDIPLVTTLHDIIYMESSYLKILAGSATPYQKFGNAYRKLVVPRVVKKSSKIITVSHFEKKRIGEFFGMKNDNRLAAVYNGVSKHFKPVTDEAELKRVKEKYQLPDNFFFFLGNTDPKKNTKGTLKAFSDFLKLTGSNYKLVMLDYDSNELEKILNEIGDKNLINKIVLTGYVINTDLPAIYCQSKIFLYPSLRESFGIPMLEAMACGVPVITSNTSSMPEVAGDAAIIINPFKPGEITAAMINLCNDAHTSAQLVESGLVQAAKFSWKAMAEDVLKIYDEIAKQ
ncbi:glycosyltransferase family 4 protein [Ferruginibacter sp. SUN106]|uniref:glycosyltransferase family 4 protein n=1 Tax=Ferruginibacter sp. SUN106 TaxID=2978348 RepID=UPI003D3695BA